MQHEKAAGVHEEASSLLHNTSPPRRNNGNGGLHRNTKFTIMPCNRLASSIAEPRQTNATLCIRYFSSSYATIMLSSQAMFSICSELQNWNFYHSFLSRYTCSLCHKPWLSISNLYSRQLRKACPSFHFAIGYFQHGKRVGVRVMAEAFTCGLKRISTEYSSTKSTQN